MRFGVILASELVTKKLGFCDIMMEKYDVYIDGKLEHSRLSEDEYFDLMEDYAEGFYTNGEPDPSSITHKVILED